MAKTKTPFFSFGARGTIGGELTAQKRKAGTLLREKPIPTYRKTLPQQYQRWLYQDYAYLWTKLSITEKQTWQTAASRYHRTGFAHFMSDRLATLPDIMGWWRFDELSGAIASDSSKNGNAGTIVGAQHVPGFICNALSFDSIDDYVNCGSGDALHITGAVTVECLYHPTIAKQGILNSLIGYNRAYQLAWHNVVGPSFLIATAAGTAYMYGSIDPIDQTYHLAGTYNGIDQNGIHMSVNGVRIDRQLVGTCSGDIEDTSGYPFYISNIGGRRPAGPLDNLIVYNRDLDQTEILRHSKRRFP